MVRNTAVIVLFLSSSELRDEHGSELKEGEVRVLVVPSQPSSQSHVVLSLEKRASKHAH